MKWFVLCAFALIFFAAVFDTAAGVYDAAVVTSTTSSKNRKTSSFMKGIRKLFHTKPKEMNALKKNIEMVVNREKQMEESTLSTTSLADPMFLKMLSDNQETLLKLILTNLDTNVKLAPNVKQQLEEKEQEEETAQTEVEDNGTEQQQQQQPQLSPLEEEQAERTAETLAALEMSAQEEEEVVDEEEAATDGESGGTKIKSDVFDEGAWKGDRPRANFFSRWFRHGNIWRAKLNREKATVEAEMKKEIKERGPLMKKHWFLGGFLLKYTHCRGLYKMLRWFNRDKRQLEDSRYLKIMFDSIELMHGVRLNREPLDVHAIVGNPEALDNVISTLEKFSVKTLLVPFRQSETSQVPEEVLNGEELAVLKAVLTNPGLARAVGERIGQKAAAATTTAEEHAAATDSDDAPLARTKRALFDEAALQVLDPAIHATLFVATSVTFGYAAIAWAAYGFLRWCYL